MMQFFRVVRFLVLLGVLTFCIVDNRVATESWPGVFEETEHWRRDSP